MLGRTDLTNEMGSYDFLAATMGYLTNGAEAVAQRSTPGKLAIRCGPGVTDVHHATFACG
jgi:hypothetical protein